MSFINWGEETPDQLALRKQIEEQALYEQAVRVSQARKSQGQTPFGGAGGSVKVEPTPPIPFFGILSLTFDDIANTSILVSDPYNVGDWNTFFDLPNYGTPFTSVEVIGNAVTLKGATNITLRPLLFYPADSVYPHLLQVIDSGCVKTIGAAAFWQCSITDIILPECTVALGDPELNTGCFELCTSLVNLQLPKLQSAGLFCFASTDSLTSISLPALTTAGDYCFGSLYLTNVSLPLLATAGVGCFNGAGLTSISLPYLVEAPESCFFGCPLTGTVSLPALETAGTQCFSGLSATTITLPALLSTGFACFYSSSSLSNVSLPSLTHLANETFLNCTALATISLPACTNMGTTTGNNDVFKNITGNTITLTVPASLMTCDSGNPDGDIAYLQANNTVTVITT